MAGSVDAVFQLGASEESRQSVLQHAEHLAMEKAVQAGAIPGTCQVGGRAGVVWTVGQQASQCAEEGSVLGPVGDVCTLGDACAKGMLSVQKNVVDGLRWLRCGVLPLNHRASRFSIEHFTLRATCCFQLLTVRPLSLSLAQVAVREEVPIG